MKKVTEQIIGAFINRQNKTIGNTRTDGTTLFLHGNAIAWHEGDKICISNAEGGSATQQKIV